MEPAGWTTEVATHELWRTAEDGNVEEMLTLLPHVADINAGNEHGTTALMRAAQHGHVRMVRVLLQHGADANLKRHDKFTALALAAFFGHMEVVRVLIAHGADSEAPTRGGTSPYMWATARTFGDVAGHLKTKPIEAVEAARVVERPRPLPLPRAAAASSPALKQEPAPAPMPAPAPKAAPIVIRTLKDPPEIWDLVHEVPKGFNASSTFVNHLRTMKASSALAGLIVLALAGGVGFLLLRGVQAHSEANLPLPRVESAAKVPVKVVPGSKTVVESPAPAAAASSVQTTPPLPSTTSASAAPSASDSAHLAPEVSAVEASAPTFARKPSSRWRSSGNSHAAEPVREQTAPVAVSAPPTAAPATEKPTVRTNTEVVAKEKASPPLNPQLIAPTKNTQPKAKVIQWP